MFLSAPTTGECTLLVAWHIDSGAYGTVKLDGLNVVLAVHSPGHMLQTKWDVAVYLDERASRQQQEALGTIFGGQAGGEPAALGPFVGKVLGVKAAKIEYEARGRHRSVRIPGVAEAEIDAIEGQGGRDVVLSNVPFIAVPNQSTIAAKSKRLTYHDHGFAWELSERNGYYSPFAFKGP